MGRKTKLVDSSAGTYTYEYNNFGETTKETTPNGTTTYTLDAIGKPTQKTIVGTNTNSKTTYTYDTASKLLSSSKFEDLTNETNTILDAFTYDTSKRITKTVETTPYAVFTKEFTYDAFGRANTETSTAAANGKSSSKVVKNTYKNGYHWQILDNATSAVLWQTNTTNARGQLLTAQNGPTTITNTYDSFGLVSQFKYDKTANSTNILTLNTVFDAKKGNLRSRTNNLFGWNESFEYDSLDRLTKFTNALGQQEVQEYDDKGRITKNSIGAYEYETDKIYQNKSIILSPEATGYYGAREGIFNDSMEDKTGWGISRYPVTAFYSYDTTKSHTGKTSLKLANTTTAEQYLFADEWVDIHNTVATEYTFSAWVFTDNPQAELFLVMKDGANVTTYNSVVNNTKAAWVPITKTFLVPAGVKKLRLRLDNNGLGNVWFDDLQIRKTSDAATTTRALNIAYNTFKSPVQIEETGVDKISFTYNNGNDRSSMFYGDLQNDKLLRTYRKHYSSDGSMEIKHNIVTGAIEFVTYIGGDGYSAPVVSKSNGTTQNYLYLQRDYQGSILAITDQAGAVIEKRLFDAWGNIIKVQDGAGNVLAGLTVLDRGYTGHEHLQSVGIIHMNGRLYDPKLHRFLQPDNFVQDPFNTQNYNRYGYVLNNPLKYTDPSGEFAWAPILVGAIIGAIIGGTSYVVKAAITGNWSWGQFGLSVLGGAVIGGITGGINPTSIIGNSVGQAVATGFVSAVLPAYGVQVGDWSFSISPAIAFGNTSGIGASLSVGYSSGDFSFSAGVGIMSNSNYNGFGKNGLEIRKSILAAYDDGKTGFSLGTNFWSGSNGMKEFKQRTSFLGFRSGDFSFGYENDGSPFSYAGKALSNNTDVYRTAAASIGIGDFSLQTNMFTGRSGNDVEGQSNNIDRSRGPNGYWANPEANMYRLGALAINYKGFRVGTNSEWVRQGFQNWLAHTIISPQPRFDMLNTNWAAYSQYQTPNKYTLW